MTDSRNDEARAIDALRRVVRALRTSGGVAERRRGLSPAQIFVLQQLAAKPEQSVSELMQRTLTSQSSVSEVVARLVAQGMVTRRRASDDGRRAVLALTPRGRSVLRSAPRSAQGRLIAGLKLLTPTHRGRLAMLLEKWLAAAGIGRTPATMFFEDSLDGKGSISRRASARRRATKSVTG
jgi:DNA-binding MarR family transcriptional regulator